MAEQAAKSPPEVIERIKAAQAEVEAAGIAPGLEVGDVAPDIILPDATGNTVSLYDRLAEGPVVLSFYRGEWCPYCNLELRALQSILPELRERGASLIAVSPQRPDDALTVTERHALEFDVLSDADQGAIREYRLQYRVPPVVEEINLEVMKNDVSQQNADGSWNLPVPATFVIGADGVIRARHVSTDYMTSRMEPSEILAALDSIAAPDEGEGG